MKFKRVFEPEEIELFEMFNLETSTGEDLFYIEDYSSGGSVVVDRDSLAYLSRRKGAEEIFNQKMQIRIDDLRTFYENAEELELSPFDWGF